MMGSEFQTIDRELGALSARIEALEHKIEDILSALAKPILPPEEYSYIDE